MATDYQADELRVRARAETTALADARGALARRPQVLMEARERNDFHDRAAPAAQTAAARGFRDNTEARGEARGRFDREQAQMKESAEAFVTARDDAEVTLGDVQMMGEELQEQGEQAQVQAQEARQARERAEARDDDDDEGMVDRARSAELDARAEANILGRVLVHLKAAGESLQEELVISKSPNFEGWGVESFFEKEELRTAITEVEQSRERRTQADQRRGREVTDNATNTKQILKSTGKGGLIGALVGGGLGAMAGAIAGTFLGSSAIGAGIGAGAGALLGGLLGAGGGALFGAVSARKDRAREAAERPTGTGAEERRRRLDFTTGTTPEGSLTTGSPQASESSSPEAGRRALDMEDLERGSSPEAAGSDDLLDRLDEDRDR